MATHPRRPRPSGPTPKGFKAATTRFSKAALTITVAADAGDKASMMKAIKATAASCKACHSVYRLK